MSNEKRTIYEFDLNIIHDYFSNTERQGPGSPEITLKALSFIDCLTEKSKLAERPAEIQDFWQKAYLEIDTIANKVAAKSRLSSGCYFCRPRNLLDRLLLRSAPPNARSFSEKA